MSAVDVHDLAEQLAPLLNGGQSRSPLLNADQAADLLNVPASWLMAEARAKRVPHRKLGKYVRFDRDDLLAWSDARSVGPRRSTTT